MEELPKIGYKTYLDRYNNACIYFIASIIVQNSLMIVLRKSLGSWDLWLFDLLTWGLLVIFWLTSHAYFGIEIWKYYSTCEPHVREIVEVDRKRARIRNGPRMSTYAYE